MEKMINYLFLENMIAFTFVTGSPWLRMLKEKNN